MAPESTSTIPQPADRELGRTTELWLTILGDDELDCYDLKLLERVKAFRRLLQHPSLAAKLFLAPPSSTSLTPGQQIRVHPALQLVDQYSDCLVDFQMPLPEYDDDDEDEEEDEGFPLAELKCAHEFATSPACTQMALTNLAYFQRKPFRLANPRGITVVDVLQAIADFWNTPCAVGMLDENRRRRGRGEEGNDATFMDAMEQTRGGEDMSVISAVGWQRSKVGKRGVVELESVSAMSPG